MTTFQKNVIFECTGKVQNELVRRANGGVGAQRAGIEPTLGRPAAARRAWRKAGELGTGLTPELPSQTGVPPAVFTSLSWAAGHEMSCFLFPSSEPVSL